VGILERVEELDGVPVDLSRLPEDLQHLTPLLRKWAAMEARLELERRQAR
jgi:hypothetical protein